MKSRRATRKAPRTRRQPRRQAKPISSFSELQAALKALPDPPPGTVRVYRGQNNDYPTLFPSGLRRSIRKRVIWLTYTGILRQSLLPQAEQASGERANEMLAAFGLWLHAVSQHYGPGSDYLDVTHSLEMALWFALNEYKTFPIEHLLGPPGPPDPNTDHLMADEVARYAPWKKPGYLYVFDLPKWDQSKGIADVGTVVDVADAPEIFSSSLRMRVQEACLVYCRGDEKTHLDMKTRLVPGTPIKIQRPMTGATGLDRRVAELFPSPEQDPWYARLLSVPLTYAPSPAPLRLRRTIPVTAYSDELNPRYEEEVRFREVFIASPLLHRWVRKQAQIDDHLKLVAEAVPIILEAPVVFPYPAASSELWHHGLLVSDLPDRCNSYSLENGEPDGELDLTNVLFEFSPLEKAGWARAVRENTPLDLLRGVWIHRASSAAEFDIGLIYQGAAVNEPDMFARFRVAYDESSGELVLVFNAKDNPIPLRQGSDVAELAGKPAIVALMLLRFLAPVLKAEPTPRVRVDADGGKFKFLIAFVWDAARLFRVVSESERDWFVMRDSAKREEPFTRTEEGIPLTIVTDQAFYQYPLNELRCPGQR